MMSRFADTWFFVGLLAGRDAHHEAVMAHVEGRTECLVTTRWVLAETANALSGSVCRGKVARFLIEAERDPCITIVGASDALYQSGLELYAERADKAWSLTDCISFVVMRQQHLREALTGDRHFAQAGFVPLFAEP
jgi:predicted nucleic acid-binding protein